MKHNNHKTRKINDGRLIELFKFYRKVFSKPKAETRETVEDQIIRINPYYTKKQSINYVDEQ